MALHELATNAGKYGALSNDEGRVQVTWKVNRLGAPAFSMPWQEVGGPIVAAPAQSGFGQTVTGRMVEAAVNGHAKIDYRASGLIWQLTAPLTDISQERRVGTAVPKATA